MLLDSVELQERRGGICEDGPCLGAGQQLVRPVDARELLRAQARALGPGHGRGLAGRLGVLEEGLVSVQLGLGVVLRRLAVGEQPLLRCLIRLLTLERGLQRCKLGRLRLHELVECPLLRVLLVCGLADAGPVAVQHTLQDALDHRRLRSIIAKGVLPVQLCGAQRASTPCRKETLRTGHEAADGLNVLGRRRSPHGAVLQHAAHVCCNAQELSLRDGLEEVASGAGSGECGDGSLESTDAALRLAMLGHVRLPLLRTDCGRVSLRSLVVGDVLLDLDNLGTMGAELSLQ
mmetsp:Transcript_115355/g.337256  ORF Transcript_115355/g.337256 Transcript_115355/m.337256 type:complete len:290 (+) Transcript_115355:1087-1956(+)